VCIEDRRGEVKNILAFAKDVVLPAHPPNGGRQMKIDARSRVGIDHLLADAERRFAARQDDVAERLYRLVQAAGTRGSTGAVARRHAVASFRIAMILERRGALEEAAAAYRALLDGAREVADEIAFAAANNLGNIERRRGRIPAARDAFAHAAAIRADRRVLVNLARVERKMGRHEEALAAAGQAIAADPSAFLPRFFRAVARIRDVCESEAAIERDRASYAEELAALAAAVETASLEARREASEAVGFVQPFYLAYHGRDDRALQETYGQMVCRLMEARCPAHARPKEPRAIGSGERVRVGIVSRFLLSTHATWRVPTSGWVRGLDRERFEVFGYLTDDREVAGEDEALFTRLRRGRGRGSVEAWAEAIACDAPDVLLFPEFGMDPLALPLGALRLAPVQAVTWGQPMTSGMPTVDAFLSSELMEPDGAEGSYSETLVRLPNLSFCASRAGAEVLPVTRETLGLSDGDVLYWCSQSLYKYRPAHDHVFAAIARDLPSARFLFSAKTGGRAATIFEARLERAFAAEGLDMRRHCLFRHGIAKDEYMGLCAIADVFLDSIGWSGCNTTFDVLEFDVPVVTLPGALMRGRHTFAILSMMGHGEGIAADEDDYVARAVRLGRDAAWRRHVRGLIAARKHHVYGDLAPVRALEEVLARAATEGTFAKTAGATP